MGGQPRVRSGRVGLTTTWGLTTTQEDPGSATGYRVDIGPFPRLGDRPDLVGAAFATESSSGEACGVVFRRNSARSVLRFGHFLNRTT